LLPLLLPLLLPWSLLFEFDTHIVLCSRSISMFTNTCRWEGTVAARKILVVVIGVFGSGMGDLQVHFMALLVVIIVLVTVYVRPHGRLRILYVLEMTSLVVLFLTLWAGMVFNSRPRCADGTGSTLPWCDFISVVIGIMNVVFVVLIATCFLSLKGVCKSCGRVQQGVDWLSRMEQQEDEEEEVHGDQGRADTQEAIRERTFDDPLNNEIAENPLHVRDQVEQGRCVELAQMQPRFRM
jgi:hypothetical protein